MNSANQIVFSGAGIASFQLSSSSYSWSIYNSLVNTMGIVFGNPDTLYVANFAKASTNCYLTLLNLGDGSIFYQNYFSCSATSGYLTEKVFSGT